MVEPLLRLAVDGRDLLGAVHDAVTQDEDPAVGTGADGIAIHVHDQASAVFRRFHIQSVLFRRLRVGDVKDRVGIQDGPRTIVQIRQGLAGRLAFGIQPVEEVVGWEAQLFPVPVVGTKILPVAMVLVADFQPRLAVQLCVVASLDTSLCDFRRVGADSLVHHRLIAADDWLVEIVQKGRRISFERPGWSHLSLNDEMLLGMVRRIAMHLLDADLQRWMHIAISMLLQMLLTLLLLLMLWVNCVGGIMQQVVMTVHRHGANRRVVKDLDDDVILRRFVG
mmetsp:Transcript_20789/g.59294  ORF Transcript_20789/g.59294 Transcript_20789/m.59294 type:complete len:279 (-) Transcript_20789:1872-2708(-)